MTTHKASLATGPIHATFTPLTTFEGHNSEGELLAVYKKGKTYFVRKGNTMLLTLAEKWQGEGKVKIN